ncbi:baseplate J/gp47 family protein [Caballeronia sp. BR00000012568055]|uniref:baseplate J/gp47 family protein n=1 Tax=Caballeronia sp. BR00000012568055 TaxID=2918761 RepID=UPI0023F6F303|nr:baseplate J/gp47 family protein [Caballeronia sp. BR00000012568055]
MPFSRPTLTQLRAQAAQQLNAELPGADALLRFSNLRVIGDIEAAQACMLYGYLDWIALQCTPFTAQDEYLEAWGALKGVTRKPCAQSSGSLVFTGTDSKIVDIGAAVQRSDGIAYTTTSAGKVAGGSVTVTASAVPDPQGLTGSNGDCAAGTQFTLSNAIAGIDSTGYAATAFLGGADIERNDDYRDRVLYVYQNPPQGGDQSDYVEWALTVPGVTRAWCVGNGYGVGSVVVYFMMDAANVAYDGFPQGTNGCATAETRGPAATGDQLTLANAIYPLRPVTALVYVIAPIPYTISISIRGVEVQYQAAVSDSIDAQLKADGQPGGEVIVSHLWSAVSAVPGVDDFLILSPTQDISLPAGALPVVGSIAWS